MPGTDLAQDRDFSALPLSDKFAYLADTDPDFKGLSAADKQAYVNHVTKAPSAPESTGSSTALERGEMAKPTVTSNPWKQLKAAAPDLAIGAGRGALQTATTLSPMINKIPVVGETLAPTQGVQRIKELTTPANEMQQAGQTAEHIGEVAIPILNEGSEARAAGKLLPFAKRLATSLVGGVAGGEAGRYAGGKVGLPQVGEAVGGLAGGLAGGGAFGEEARKIGNPRDIPVVGKYFPDLLKAPEVIPHVTAPVPVAPKPVVSSEPFELKPLDAGREEPIQETFPNMNKTQAAPAKPQRPLDVLENLLNEQSGVKPLKPDVPLRDQMSPRPLGADAIHPMAVNPRTGVIPNVPLGSRVATPIAEEFGPTAKAPGDFSRSLTEEPARQAGGGPLRPGVSLKDQPKFSEAPIRSEQARLEEKYPDRASRQMVHANGEQMVDAIGNDPDLMKQVHELTNPDVRQAMINSGEDMGQKMINNRKASGDMSRQEAFARLLQKGLKPRQIVQLARQSMNENVGKPGLMRSDSSAEGKRHQAGD